MSLQMRKLALQTEEIHIEGGRPADPPLVMHGVVAVIANPWACLLYTSPSPRD